jgi:hypothetical protein
MKLLKDDTASSGWILFAEFVGALVAGTLIYLILSVFYSGVQLGAFNAQGSNMTMNNSTVQGFNVLSYAWQSIPLLGFIIILAGVIVMAVAARLRAS